MSGRARSRSRALRSAAVALALVAVLTACATRPGTAVTTTPTGEPTPTAAASSSPSASPSSSPVPSPEVTDDVQPEPVAPTAGPVSVTIVNVGADGQKISASGLVTGSIEDGGVCTLTATAVTGRILTGSVDAVSTPAAVNCGIIDIAASPGEWSVVLTYRSGATSAVSEPVTVTQP